MKRIMIGSIACLWCLSASAYAQPAMEKAEKRLAELLALGNSGSTFRSGPVTWKATFVVEDLSAPIKPYAGITIRLQLAPLQAPKPRSAPEASPLVSIRDKSPAPQQVELASNPLIRVPSVDLNTPLPIPILAQPTADRASLGDPALEASIDAALKQVSPSRNQPVPFSPMNLPDPFENVRFGQFRNAPSEIAMPPVIPVPRPTSR